jgi:hypothetical protein
MKKLFILFISLILLISACTKTDIRVQGFMKTTNGQPIHGLPVSIQKSKKIFETTTDQTGFYMFENVPVGTWEFSVGKGLYEIHIETVYISGGSSENIYHKDFTFVITKP